jgi:hypothetical protein
LYDKIGILFSGFLDNMFIRDDILNY